MPYSRLLTGLSFTDLALNRIRPTLRRVHNCKSQGQMNRHRRLQLCESYIKVMNHTDTADKT